MAGRSVRNLIVPEEVIEGAGVRLRRSIGTRSFDHLDPFLLFDDFSSPDPDDHSRGFPLHPHRGIETVTYLLEGAVKHRDTTGASGTLGAGDVQWMTAGRGILHEEMPQAMPGGIKGFQLWVNLPAKLKMTAPKYQEIPSSKIPVAELKGGVRAHVITGNAAGVAGAVKGIAGDVDLNVLHSDATLYGLKS